MVRRLYGKRLRVKVPSVELRWFAHLQRIEEDDCVKKCVEVRDSMALIVTVDQSSRGWRWLITI